VWVQAKASTRARSNQPRARSRCAAQVLLREAPAGERFGVAVHDAQAQPADLGRQRHRQRRERFALPVAGRKAQPSEDAVRALDHRVADPGRVGAAAAGVVGVVGGQLGLDVAAQRVVREHGALHPVEDFRVDVEPVEVAVEHQPLAAAFAVEEFEHALQRVLAAVQPADDVQHLQSRSASGGGAAKLSGA
jgi:hypothetical protein